jgi:hypothetical protein|tara:strand:+ start:279 stop:416 length:138 start_codon:yes stop_codon:yes gene_type:complete
MKEAQKRKIKKVAKALNKASRSHAGQAKTLSTLAKSKSRYYGKKK